MRGTCNGDERRLTSQTVAKCGCILAEQGWVETCRLVKIMSDHGLDCNDSQILKALEGIDKTGWTQYQKRGSIVRINSLALRSGFFKD